MELSNINRGRYSNIGGALDANGQHDEAINYFEQALSCFDHRPREL